ncbi:MAG: hypothetical protein JRG86_17550 [Deltaproteobacteria bacterium]|nr:hypothetical protein [Deltaproteobacteria bacterium]MBW2497779.1 hypothetical protein [Deltaproteobacteria bacterium]
MSVDAVHESPHASDDAAYCETWAYSLTDLERGWMLLVHSSWLPARSVGNHLVMLQRAGQAPTSLRTESRNPFESDLFRLEVDPWKKAHVHCPELSLDLDFEAFTPPIDFGERFDLGEGMRQRHVQAGVRASGSIAGERLRLVPGFRDRSWGPRDMRHMGRLVALLMTGVDRDLFVTVNSITHCDRPFSAGPDTTLGCSAIDGEIEVFDRAPVVLRHQDGTPACFELPSGLAVDLDFDSAFHESRFLADRTSAPERFPTADPVLMIRLWALAAEARGLGRMAGSYQEGILFTN